MTLRHFTPNAVPFRLRGRVGTLDDVPAISYRDDISDEGNGAVALAAISTLGMLGAAAMTVTGTLEPASAVFLITATLFGALLFGGIAWIDWRRGRSLTVSEPSGRLVLQPRRGPTAKHSAITCSLDTTIARIHPIRTIYHNRWNLTWAGHALVVDVGENVPVFVLAACRSREEIAGYIETEASWLRHRTIPVDDLIEFRGGRAWRWHWPR